MQLKLTDTWRIIELGFHIKQVIIRSRTLSAEAIGTTPTLAPPTVMDRLPHIPGSLEPRKQAFNTGSAASLRNESDK